MCLLPSRHPPAAITNLHVGHAARLEQSRVKCRHITHHGAHWWIAIHRRLRARGPSLLTRALVRIGTVVTVAPNLWNCPSGVGKCLFFFKCAIGPRWGCFVAGGALACRCVWTPLGQFQLPPGLVEVKPVALRGDPRGRFPKKRTCIAKCASQNAKQPRKSTAKN